MARIYQIDELRRLLGLLAAQAGGLLTQQRLAGEIGVSKTTVAHYLAILETVFIIKSVPGWKAGAATRAVAKPN